MAEEKTFIIPLRKEFMKAPSYKKTKKAVAAVRVYLSKHLKSMEVRIGPNLNNFLWTRGNKNPPNKIKVKALKDEKNIIRVELPEFKIEIPTGKSKENDKNGKNEDVKEQEKKEKTDLTLTKNIKKAARGQFKKSSEDSDEPK